MVNTKKFLKNLEILYHKVWCYFCYFYHILEMIKILKAARIKYQALKQKLEEQELENKSLQSHILELKSDLEASKANQNVQTAHFQAKNTQNMSLSEILSDKSVEKSIVKVSRGF